MSRTLLGFLAGAAAATAVGALSVKRSVDATLARVSRQVDEAHAHLSDATARLQANYNSLETHATSEVSMLAARVTEVEVALNELRRTAGAPASS